MHFTSLSLVPVVPFYCVEAWPTRRIVESSNSRYPAFDIRPSSYGVDDAIERRTLKSTIPDITDRRQATEAVHQLPTRRSYGCVRCSSAFVPSGEPRREHFE